MLGLIDQIMFLCIVALGCYTQAITGFSLGLILVSLSALFSLMSIELASIVVSLISIANTGLALIRSGCHVRWRMVTAVLVTGIPATYAGVVLLEHMSESSHSLLRLLLGITIIGSSLLLVLNPRTLARESGLWSFGGLGAIAGLLGGMFAAFGAPLIFQFYRQPMKIVHIRDSLLLIFFLVSIARVGFLLVKDAIPQEAYVQALIALPITLAFTVLGGKLPPIFSDLGMRRLAFSILMLAGIGMMIPDLSG